RHSRGHRAVPRHGADARRPDRDCPEGQLRSAIMPGAFHYRENVLYCEDVELSQLAARAGTPCYVYSAAALRANFLAYERALEGVPHRVCYAVKANSNLAVLRLLAGLGAGFDIVSGGELFRVLK